VGVGHKLPAGADPNKGYTKNEVLNFLNEDLNLARKNAERVVQEYGGNLNLLDVGPQVILTNIAAQTGGGKYSNIKDVLAGRMDKSELGGLAGFQNAVEAAISGDWARFKTEVMNSKLGREQATDRYTQLTNEYLDINSDKNILQKEVINDPNSVKRAGIARPTFERPQTLGVTRDQISGVASTEVLPETRSQIATRADINNIVEQNLDAAENMDDSEFRNSLRNIDLENMTTKEKFTPTFSAMDLPAQPDFQPKFVMDYGFGTEGSPDVTPAVPQQEFKLFDMSRFTTSVDRALEAIGFKERETRPLDPSIGQLPANLPSGFQFDKPQLSNVPATMSRASLAEQTQNLLQKPDVAGVSSIRTESPTSFQNIIGDSPFRSPTDLSAPFGAKKAPTIKTSPLTQPSSLADFEPKGERKVTDAKAFLEARKKKEEKETKPEETKTETKPAKQPKEQTVISRAEEDSKRREEQERNRDKFDDQGNFIQQSTDDFMRDVYAKNVASGYYESSPMYGERDPLGRYSYNEGGLASKPKKTKPKKRNVKKGLGGKMAT
jgi:hypothetical protein